MQGGTIVIAGGGVGGLATALALGRKGWKVRVLEQAPQFGAIGYGIQLGPNVFPMFERLGLTAAVLDKSIVPGNVWMFDAMDGKPVTRVHIGPEFLKRYKHPYIVIHRVDLHEILMAACRAVPSIVLDEKAQVTSYTDHGSTISVALADGRTVEGDLLIGADGLRSRVREQMAGASEPELIGYVAHRTIVPIAEAPKDIPLDDVILWGGPGFHIVNYPLRDKSVFNIVAVFRTDTFAEKGDVESYRAELQHTYRNAHPAMRQMIAMMDLERRWPIADRSPQKGWSQGRVVLIGDSAHATLQSLAQGACMAIEDAVVLGELIDLCDGDYAKAFARFEKERLLRTARVQLESRYMWNMLYHTGDLEAQVRNEAYRPRSDDEIYKCLDWLYHAPEVPTSF
ncbi:MAG: FAD-dependent monooxygenase [Beijerinckiaceae bacterium]|nr:FAD-dependent monooxygenase [Beijerinckiaceae bacterium]